VTPYLLATPVVSMLIGALFLGDVLTGQILTGAALTIAGVGVVALAERGLRAGAAKA
jgi:O-acetylserine/cysteine efflux transporter